MFLCTGLLIFTCLMLFTIDGLAYLELDFLRLYLVFAVLFWRCSNWVFYSIGCFLVDLCFYLNLRCRVGFWVRFVALGTGLSTDMGICLSCDFLSVHHIAERRQYGSLLYKYNL
ncbi:hypothetical protein Hanom_Chr11g01032291 [Helianthus anomalus]